MTPPRLLTIQEFSKVFQTSRRSVYTLFQQGLPKLKLPGLGVRIPREQAEEWILARSEAPKANHRESLTNKKIDLSPQKINTSRVRTSTKTYSLSFNQKREVWIAQVRKAEGGWQTKYLPKAIGEHQQLEAEAYLFNWLPAYLKTGETKQAETPKNRTIRFLASRWLTYRNNDGTTSPNTLRGFAQSLSTWILTNPKFPHTSIQDLDIPTQLNVQVLSSWIDSLGQSPSSKLSQISCLRSLLNDCIALGWVDAEMMNPLSKPAIVAKERSLKSQKESKRVNAYLTLPQIEQLLSFQNSYMTDYKRMRYLLALTTGLRDSEIQALQWKDLDLTAGTIRVNKQLFKRGCLPILDYFEARKTRKAEEIALLPNAVSKEPKEDSKRILPLPSLTIQALVHWKRVGWQPYTKLSPTEESPVFPRSATSLKPGEKPGHFCYTDAAEGLQTDLGRAGIPTTFTDAMGGEAPITFHSLRHSYSHLLDSVGADDVLIGLLLGHKGKSVGRQVYIPANIEKWREVVDKLPLSSVQFRHRAIGRAPVLKLVKSESA
jgi:integrase/predicted DNA-binding transcriptional regulator AlpA